MFSYSGFGPTLDGRFKPEIVAPGGSVYGAAKTWVLTLDAGGQLVPALNLGQCISPADGSTNYYLNQLFTCEPYPATSYASPAVSGAIQLLWWYFQNRLNQ